MHGGHARCAKNVACCLMHTQNVACSRMLGQRALDLTSHRGASPPPRGIHQSMRRHQPHHGLLLGCEHRGQESVYLGHMPSIHFATTSPIILPTCENAMPVLVGTEIFGRVIPCGVGELHCADNVGNGRARRYGGRDDCIRRSFCFWTPCLDQPHDFPWFGTAAVTKGVAPHFNCLCSGENELREGPLYVQAFQFEPAEVR